MQKPADHSRTISLSELHKSPQLENGLHLRRYSQVTLETATSDFNSDQFNTRIKKIAAQVSLYLNAALFNELSDAWKLALFCPIKVLLRIVSANVFLWLYTFGLLNGFNPKKEIVHSSCFFTVAACIVQFQ